MATNDNTVTTVLPQGKVSPNRVVSPAQIRVSRPGPPYAEPLARDIEGLSSDLNQLQRALTDTVIPTEAKYANFTPSISAAGSMTVSTVGVSYYHWIRQGPDIFLQFDVGFVLGGTASQFVYITTPLAGIPAPTGQALTCMMQVGSGAWVAGYVYTDQNPAARLIATPMFANWSLGICRILVSGRIRVA